ncbi:hypothetical protein LLEC1_01132 [Akanthomyces lecanii]|uniref:20S-pre-rRNA D-site endonuclease NOB1 n=1 Tax=Cordyceps confragosa TaxID=2714763 RepID=A0A179IJY4_CORDF|nr:hypothetical protein LLEC1_01132 [Akanthomyces lecanii]
MATPHQTPPSESPAATTTGKPIHSLVLDTGPLIKNDPTVSALLAQAEQLYILPSVVPEIRDTATRTRVETQLLPFVTVRAPSSKSVAIIREFARKTGDLGVLSKPDIEVLALGYDLECERNGGDWRLRNSPDQKQVNGKPPHRTQVTTETTADAAVVEAADSAAMLATDATVEALETLAVHDTVKTEDAARAEAPPESVAATIIEPGHGHAKGLENLSTSEDTASEAVSDEDDGEASDDDGGWITPSNVNKHKTQGNGSTPAKNPQRTLQAAVLTSDFAMQNVALRMNLNLITPSFSRITQLKTWVLRCHGCFKVTKDMEKQFCPSCGQPTLIRTSCSTDEKGNFRLHLKKGFQWNNRGNVYSVPKPVHGTPHGRLAKHAGGQNNWGASLLLAEDQKEYLKASDAQRKQKKKDLMDDEFLPGILTGDRSGSGKIKVGAGRTINSRRRR